MIRIAPAAAPVSTAGPSRLHDDPVPARSGPAERDAFAASVAAPVSERAAPTESFVALAARQEAAVGAALGEVSHVEALMGDARALRRLHELLAPLLADDSSGQALDPGSTASSSGDRSLEVRTGAADVLYDDEELSRVIAGLAARDAPRGGPYVDLTLYGTGLHRAGAPREELAHFAAQLGRHQVELLDDSPERFSVKVSPRAVAQARRVDVLTVDLVGSQRVLTFKSGTLGVRRLLDRRLGEQLSIDLAELFPSSQSVRLEVRGHGRRPGAEP